jgi:hypothetical protein
MMRCYQSPDDRAKRDAGRSHSTKPRSATKRAPGFGATRRDRACRAADFVGRLMKGATLHCATRLVTHPDMPPSHFQFLLK